MPDTEPTEVPSLTTITTTWRGHTFTLPASLDDSPVEVLEAFEDGKLLAAVRGVLGPKQYADLKQAERMTVRDVGELSDVIAKAMGLGSAGE